MPRAVFDLHCDTLTAVLTPLRAKDTLDDPCSVFALSKLPQDLHWCQCCAVYVPDGLTPQESLGYYRFHRRSFQRQCDTLSHQALPCTQAQDVTSAWDQDKTALVLTVENGSLLGAGLDIVEELSWDGVRMVTLTWNGENALGSGHQTDHGLSPLGRDAVRALEEAGIIVDVSHLNDAGFRDVLDTAQKPFAASHSNSRAVCPHRRNLEDWQIREMVARHCLIGLNYYNQFLRSDGNPAELSDFYRHICHFLELGAEDCLALGSDFDGAALPPCMDDCTKVPALGDYLLSQGLDAALVEKIFWKNALDFAQKNWV